MKLKIAIFSLLGTGLFACSHNSNIDNQPAMSFASDIQPIMKATCATEGCHSRGGEFSLETYEEVLNTVKPGDARGSELYKVITRRSTTIMPPAPSTIADEDITKIYLWIEAGAKNN